VSKSCKYEIGTEQAIRKFSSDDLRTIFTKVKEGLGDLFRNVVFGVIQGGTSITGNKNTGVFDKQRFIEMINICKEFGLLSKEHNGDYLSNDEIKLRFDLGLDAINIAPEYGYIETNTILEQIIANQDEKLFEDFFSVCYRSNKWKKWLNEDFLLTEFTKHVIIKVSGHYVFADEEFKQIKNKLPDIDNKIKDNIKRKLQELLWLVK
jgi:hypothetical protein